MNKEIQVQAENWEWLEKELSGQPGHVSCLYKNLKTGEQYLFGEKTVHPSASVIKIYLMAYVFQLVKDGKLSLNDQVALQKDNVSSSSGVLHYLRDVESMSVRDLVELMIIVSDNTATNLLVELVGMDHLQNYIAKDLGLSDTKFQRKMMDFAAIRAGRQNYTTAADAAFLLEQIYRGELVSKEASAQMLEILKDQQFQDLIPAYLEDFIPERSIAHKTGGLERVVHDAAIVDYGKAPFILCFFGSDVTVSEYSIFIGKMALRIYEQVQNS